jgi:hypothetical protein
MDNTVDIPALVAQIARGDPDLTVVKLNAHNSRDEKGALEAANPATALLIAKAITDAGENCKVVEIQLSAANVKNDGAIAIGNALKTNKSVERLSLETNHIDGDGIKALLEAIASGNSTLQELKAANQSKPISSDAERCASCVFNCISHCRALCTPPPRDTEEHARRF